MGERREKQAPGRVEILSEFDWNLGGGGGGLSTQFDWCQHRGYDAAFLWPAAAVGAGDGRISNVNRQ